MFEVAAKANGVKYNWNRCCAVNARSAAAERFVVSRVLVSGFAVVFLVLVFMAS